MMGLYVILIEKANKILDYVLTNFLLQVLIVWLFNGFPIAISFWCINGLKVAIETVISEYIALKIEQQEIIIHTNFISGNM